MGQNEDYSPGGSISNSSEKLLLRGRGEGQYICDFGEGGVHSIKNTFLAEACVRGTMTETTALARHHSNNLHELSYNRRSWYGMQN